jgi:hypothetical protein
VDDLSWRLDADLLNPMHDAVGKLVLTASNAEWCMSYALSRLSIKFDFEAAHRLPHMDRVAQLEEVAEVLPTPQGQQMATALRSVEDLFELRHAVLHSGKAGTAESDWVTTQRSHRDGHLINVGYSRESLLEAIRKARPIFDACWTDLHREDWPGLIGATRDE